MNSSRVTLHRCAEGYTVLMSHMANISLLSLNFVAAVPGHLRTPKHDREVGNLRHVETLHFLLKVLGDVCETRIVGFVGPGLVFQQSQRSLIKVKC